MSMASVIAGRGLEAVVWDKDMLRKEYLGELSLPMKEWFPGGTVVFMDESVPVSPFLTLRVRACGVGSTASCRAGREG